MRAPTQIKYRGHLYKLAASAKMLDMLARLKGGFSDAVLDSPAFMDYIDQDPSKIGGYIGNRGRTKEFDAALEKLLKAQGLGPNGIATWLTSGTARHMMDPPILRTTPLATFLKRAKEYTKDAAKDIAIWSHPDHGGLQDTQAVHDHLTSLFGGKK
jgi:hypothetical protein